MTNFTFENSNFGLKSTIYYAILIENDRFGAKTAFKIIQYPFLDPILFIEHDWGTQIDPQE